MEVGQGSAVYILRKDFVLINKQVEFRSLPMIEAVVEEHPHPPSLLER